MRLFLGTYPHDREDLPAEGIWTAELDRSTGALTDVTQRVEIESPSFICFGKDQSTLLAVSENANGELFEFSIADTELTYAAHTRTRGADPCHLIAAGNQVIATNYSSGSVFAHRAPLAEHLSEGSGQLFQQAGTGPNADRQEGPHAHFAGAVPGTQFVWVADLGADRIFRYVVTTNADGEPQCEARGTAVAFPAGAGPRHIAFAQDGIAYVVGELDSRVYVVRIDEGDGSGEIIGSVVLPLPAGAQEAGALASHIELDASGHFLFVTVRGPDTIYAFEVGRADAHARVGFASQSEGALGAGSTIDDDTELSEQDFPELLSLRAEHAVVGAWPRHFRVIDGADSMASQLLVVVANQGSSTVDVLGFDRAVQDFSVLSSTAVPVPACVLPQF